MPVGTCARAPTATAAEPGPVSDLEVGSALELLRLGEFVVVGRLVDASNATLFC